AVVRAGGAGVRAPDPGAGGGSALGWAGPHARQAERADDRERQHPPRRPACVGHEVGDGDGGDDDHRDRPVVADDEVVPEVQEPADVAHAIAASSRAVRLRASATRPSEEATTKASTARMAASPPPGQSAPAPSAAQNVPKLVSMTPTPNFIVFSGTRLSGAWTTAPTTRTTTSAAAAAAAARPTAPCVAPNVTTMNATSRPSRNTPLNATVNAYQSRPARSSITAVRASSTSARKMASSSWRALRP